jgi:hypothetical protein
VSRLWMQYNDAGAHATLRTSGGSTHPGTVMSQPSPCGIAVIRYRGDRLSQHQSAKRHLDLASEDGLNVGSIRSYRQSESLLHRGDSAHPITKALSKGYLRQRPRSKDEDYLEGQYRLYGAASGFTKIEIFPKLVRSDLSADLPACVALIDASYYITCYYIT